MNYYKILDKLMKKSQNLKIEQQILEIELLKLNIHSLFVAVNH